MLTNTLNLHHCQNFYVAKVLACKYQHPNFNKLRFQQMTEISKRTHPNLQIAISKHLKLEVHQQERDRNPRSMDGGTFQLSVLRSSLFSCSQLQEWTESASAQVHTVPCRCSLYVATASKTSSKARCSFKNTDTSPPTRCLYQEDVRLPSMLVRRNMSKLGIWESAASEEQLVISGQVPTGARPSRLPGKCSLAIFREHGVSHDDLRAFCRHHLRPSLARVVRLQPRHFPKCTENWRGVTPRSTQEQTIAQSIEQIVRRHQLLEVQSERLEVVVLRFWAATKHCHCGHSRLPTALFEDTNLTYLERELQV